MSATPAGPGRTGPGRAGPGRARLPADGGREAAADSRPDSGTGSSLFEINIWMLKYRRTFPREFSVKEAVAMRKQRLHESRARAAETLQHRREAAWAKGSSSTE